MVRITSLAEFYATLPGRLAVVTCLMLTILALLVPIQAWAVGQVGEPGADFTLQDSNPGDWHTLSDYQGNVVILFMIGYL
jgi:hypothetical protein